MTNNILNTLKKSFFISLGTVALSIGLAQTAKADVLTFDDVTNDEVRAIPRGYGELVWNNFRVIDKNLFTGSGYDNGTVSGNYTAFNANAEPATIFSSNYNTLFDFNSAFLTSAWENGNSITVEGFAGGISKYLMTVIVNTNAATKFDFNFLGVDTLRFSSSNLQFAMDNFTFNESVTSPNPTSVPEPSLLVSLFIITPSAAAWLKRKKLKQGVQ
jgi:hypothetical protein